jgi:uncharacterized protein
MSASHADELPEDECWRLLAADPVGRLGVIFDGMPEILPVNHVVDGRSIVFRTGPGSKLAGLTATPAVCYQVDGIDDDGHTGWSVLVKGRATEVPPPPEDADDLRPDYWTVGDKEHWVRIEPTEVTGRRMWVRVAHLMGTPDDAALVVEDPKALRDR